MKRIAMYAGSFDPITNGHLWMIERAIEMFDKLIVLIASNPTKKYMFDIPTRADMVFKCLEEHYLVKQNIEVHVLGPDDYVVNYAMKLGVKFLLRGIRTVADFDYERSLNLINTDIEPIIHTIFLMPPRHLAEISSSTVKSILGPVGWQDIVYKYVPMGAYDELLHFSNSMSMKKSVSVLPCMKAVSKRFVKPEK